MEDTHAKLMALWKEYDDRKITLAQYRIRHDKLVGKPKNDKDDDIVERIKRVFNAREV